jgi:hypothetical protein
MFHAARFTSRILFHCLRIKDKEEGWWKLKEKTMCLFSNFLNLKKYLLFIEQEVQEHCKEIESKNEAYFPNDSVCSFNPVKQIYWIILKRICIHRHRSFVK